MYDCHATAAVTDARHAPAQSWEKQFTAAGVGGFFTPCAYLKDRAASGKELSAGVSAASKL